VVELVQIAVGLIQADTGLPGILVGVHMTLAAVLTAGMTAVILALTAPVASGAADQDTGVSATGDARVA
jgi:cytochrome c oxidase assembly protein subunit 15